MEALSNAAIKRIQSLGDTKGRRRQGLFMAEGTKCVLTLAGKYTLRHLYARKEWLDSNSVPAGCAVSECGGAELRQISRLNTLPPVIGLFDLPQTSERLPDANVGFLLALDCVQDPGNLGTIIRTCDWMGIHDIVASTDTVDAFNPKTVQASMGSLANVNIHYTSLPDYLSGVTPPVFGTFLGGEDAFGSDFGTSGVLVMGNEGNGIRPEVERLVSRRITIPCAASTVAESLNVATATAMLLAIRQKNISLHK